MDLANTFVDNYASWDGVESAILEIARRPVDSPAQPQPLRNPNTADTISVTKWRALSRRELAVSLGAYTGADRAVLIPKAVLLSNVEPKPGDVMVRADGSRWTALEVQLGKSGQTWRLTCRNLVIHFNLRDLIDIERATVVYDDAGTAIKKFPTGPAALLGGEVLYGDLPCRVQLMTNEIAEERGIRGFRGSYAVYLSREVQVTNEDRIRLTQDSTDGLPAGTYLEVRDYHQAQTIDNLSVIAAEKAV